MIGVTGGMGLSGKLGPIKFGCGPGKPIVGPGPCVDRIEGKFENMGSGTGDG